MRAAAAVALVIGATSSAALKMLARIVRINLDLIVIPVAGRAIPMDRPRPAHSENRATPMSLRLSAWEMNGISGFWVERCSVGLWRNCCRRAILAGCVKRALTVTGRFCPCRLLTDLGPDLRIEANFRTAAANARTATGRAQGGALFQPAGAESPARAASAAPTMRMTALDAILTLQCVEDALSAPRRKAVRRGRACSIRSKAVRADLLCGQSQRRPTRSIDGSGGRSARANPAGTGCVARRYRIAGAGRAGQIRSISGVLKSMALNTPRGFLFAHSPIAKRAEGKPAEIVVFC